MYWCKGKTNNIGYTSYDSNMILYDFLFISPFKILISVGMLKDVEDELQRKVKVSLDFHESSHIFKISLKYKRILYLIIPLLLFRFLQSTRSRQGEQRDPEVELDVRYKII